MKQMIHVVGLVMLATLGASCSPNGSPSGSGAKVVGFNGGGGYTAVLFQNSDGSLRECAWSGSNFASERPAGCVDLSTQSGASALTAQEADARAATQAAEQAQATAAEQAAAADARAAASAAEAATRAAAADAAAAVQAARSAQGTGQ